MFMQTSGIGLGMAALLLLGVLKAAAWPVLTVCIKHKVFV